LLPKQECQGHPVNDLETKSGKFRELRWIVRQQPELLAFLPHIHKHSPYLIIQDFANHSGGIKTSHQAGSTKLVQAIAAEQWQDELIQPFPDNGYAEEAPGVLDHEVDALGVTFW
jgi:hypothetical protein